MNVAVFCSLGFKLKYAENAAALSPAFTIPGNPCENTHEVCSIPAVFGYNIPQTRFSLGSVASLFPIPAPFPDEYISNTVKG